MSIKLNIIEIFSLNPLKKVILLIKMKYDYLL